MTTGDTISYSVDGPVAVIALNKPKLNTLDIAVLDGLIAALRRAGGDDSIALTTELFVDASILGGADNDTLIGPNQDVDWEITDPGEGSGAGATFAGIETLQGGTESDRFILRGAGSLASGLTGGAGDDTA